MTPLPSSTLFREAVSDRLTPPKTLMSRKRPGINLGTTISNHSSYRFADIELSFLVARGGKCNRHADVAYRMSSCRKSTDSTTYKMSSRKSTDRTTYRMSSCHQSTDSTTYRVSSCRKSIDRATYILRPRCESTDRATYRMRSRRRVPTAQNPALVF